jgi:predicted type IV restriction endonuclease
MTLRGAIMATIPKSVSDRLKTQTKKYQKVLTSAIDRDVNESDTVAIITDMLASIYGYDKFLEVTSEFAIKGSFCDLAVVIDGGVKFLIEAKAIGLDLKEMHLRQAIGYGAQHGIQWVVLTNGKIWEIYRIQFRQPVTSELLTSYNFLDLNPRKKEDLETLFLLCKEGLSKDAIEEFHKHVQGVNKSIIGALMLSEKGVNFLSRELKRTTPGLRVSDAEVESILRGEVLKRDLLEGENMGDAMARVKKGANRKLLNKK